MSDPDDAVGPAAESKKTAPVKWSFLRSLVKVCFVLGILFILFSVLCAPMPPGNIGGQTSSWMQVARQIGMMMVAYSNDHDGNYADGKSSTEVFQKLLDGKYCTDPTVFYIQLAGKIEPVVGQKLKPENVCWDVTSGVDSGAPDGLPVVFMTCYKVTYAPGGSAMPIIKPYPRFGRPRTWTQWYYRYSLQGIAVFYKGNNAIFKKLDVSANPDGTIPNFVPPDFDAKGKTYRQLTPDGPLPQ